MTWMHMLETNGGKRDYHPVAAFSTPELAMTYASAKAGVELRWAPTNLARANGVSWIVSRIPFDPEPPSG